MARKPRLRHENAVTKGRMETLTYRKARAVVLLELRPDMPMREIARECGISDSTVRNLKALGPDAMMGNSVLVEKLRDQEKLKVAKILHLYLDRLADPELAATASIRDAVQAARMGFELGRTMDGQPTSYIGLSDETLEQEIERRTLEITQAKIIEITPEEALGAEEAQIEYYDEEGNDDEDESPDESDEGDDISL